MVSSPRDPSARMIQSPTVAMCFSVRPREVTEGVPMRTPEVTNGERPSNGMVFLLTTMPALFSQASASLPVMSLMPTLTRIKWVSVPPETMR